MFVFSPSILTHNNGIFNLMECGCKRFYQKNNKFKNHSYRIMVTKEEGGGLSSLNLNYVVSKCLYFIETKFEISFVDRIWVCHKLKLSISPWSLQPNGDISNSVYFFLVCIGRNKQYICVEHNHENSSVLSKVVFNETFIRDSHKSPNQTKYILQYSVGL